MHYSLQFVPLYLGIFTQEISKLPRNCPANFELVRPVNKHRLAHEYTWRPFLCEGISYKGSISLSIHLATTFPVQQIGGQSTEHEHIQDPQH